MEMVQEEAAKAAGRYPVCTLGPIIHNDTVIRQLRDAGVTVIESPEEAPGDGVVVIRAHGVSLAVSRQLEEAGVRYADATCPFVAKVHRIVAAQPPETVVLVAGDPGHPEVQGITGI